MARLNKKDVEAALRQASTLDGSGKYTFKNSVAGYVIERNGVEVCMGTLRECYCYLMGVTHSFMRLGRR